MQRVVGSRISGPCFVMVMCVINVMPVLFLLLLHCSTPLLSLLARALLTSPSVMQPVRTSINSLHHDCSAGRTEQSTVILSFVKDTKFATIVGPHPPTLPCCNLFEWKVEGRWLFRSTDDNDMGGRWVFLLSLIYLAPL